MITAKEWTENLRLPEPKTIGDNNWIAIFEQVQLDAMKEGMRRAAGIAQTQEQGIWEVKHNKAIHDARFAILTAAEQLTEKDL